MTETDLFSLPREEGKNKVCSVTEAIRRHIRPGMTIHLGSTHARPNALMNELIRRYDGKGPGFTIVTAGLVSNMVILLHQKLVKKVISTFCGDNYPSPAPNPVIRKAYVTGDVEFENWSILTLPLRLMAGAMGVPFLPTHSLRGSQMERDNRASYFVLRKGGKTTGMVGALHPDITLIHGVIGDKNGNIVLTPPYGADVHGALASRKGVIASVEKVVSTEEIRRHSHLVRIPGHIVAAVCPAPFGAHPNGHNGRGIEGCKSYADDYDFLDDVRAASRDEKRLDSWIRTWILGPRTHEKYLKLLGDDRIARLKKKAHPDSWRYDLPSLDVPLDPPRPSERLAAMGARLLCTKAKKEDYTTILAGIGISNLSAWLAHSRLRAEGQDIELMAEVGFYGYDPRPADPFIFNFRNIPTCKMLSNTETIMGILMGGTFNRCIGAVGAGQIDAHGNINSTLIPGKQYLTGSGGANDICSSAQEVVVTTFQGRERLVKKVAYVTSPGTRVRTLVTDLGVFEKFPGSDTLTLSGYFPLGHEEDVVREIKAKCGWALKTVRRPGRLSLPGAGDLRLLRLYDPKGQFLK